VRFLIVDDDPACRELLKAILSPYAECDLAFDGSEAVDAVRLAIEEGQPYDLITLDIMMPGVDGHQALERIRQLEKQHDVCGSDGVKVIITTALSDSKHCIQSFKEGCESYCIKPIKQDDLLLLVWALLGELPKRPQLGTENSPSRAADVCPTAEPKPRSAAGNSSGQDDRGRYLIVDDDGVCRELLRDYLSPHGRCDLAYDGREAIDAVRLALEDEDPYDLVCLDIMMPGTSGHDALKAIRALEAERGIHGSDGVKVIMTTALRDSKHCIQSFKEGCECYVTKPIDQDVLLGKMHELGLLATADAP
jgi:two-component system chemotaxis response regulator CheY